MHKGTCSLALLTFCLPAPTFAAPPSTPENPAQSNGTVGTYSQAEFAVRWDANVGGPKTAADAVVALKVQETDKPDTYQVRYFHVTPPPGTPESVGAILRERSKPNKGKYQLMFKYRGPSPLPDSLSICPLGSGSTEAEKEKLEVDVSILKDGSVDRAYSYSCTLKSDSGPLDPPVSLNASPNPCRISMTRHVGTLGDVDLDIEEWAFPNGKILVEVSSKSANTPQALAHFQEVIVAPLVKAGIDPVTDGKTKLASQCNK